MLSESAGFAAWLYADLDDQVSASQHYALAIAAAQASRHSLLVPYMRASLGHYLALTGDPLGARSLMAQARSSLGCRAPLIATVWLDAIDSVVLASAGDSSAMSALNRAERGLSALDGQEPMWPWVFRFDHTKLVTYRAVAAARLGRSSDATDGVRRRWADPIRAEAACGPRR